jgi:hypothetical protein
MMTEENIDEITAEMLKELAMWIHIVLFLLFLPRFQERVPKKH